MKISKTKRIILTVLGALTAFSFAGTMTATMAWFAYSSRAIVSFMGTSVSSSQQLQVGIKISADDFSNDIFSSFIGIDGEGFAYQKINSQNYVWAPAGSGLKSDVLRTYLGAHGYATNSLMPSTSSEYNYGDDLTLYRSPRCNDTVLRDAEERAYCKIPLVFRVIQTDLSTTTYSKNQPIWVTDAVAEAANSTSGEIYKALRVHFDGYEKFIFNPSASEEGSTKVGGLLDLNGDGYYDFDGNYGPGKEVLYGKYDSSASESTKIATAADEENLSDINHTNTSDASTFLAKHKEGNTMYNTLDNLGIKEADYKSLNDIYPTVTDGYYSGGTPVCITSNDAKAIGEVDMTIYLEGWDHSVVVGESESMFNLGLQFEINKI